MTTFSAPGSSRVMKPAQVRGHLLILRPLRLTMAESRLGEDQAIIVDVVDLSAGGEVFDGCTWFSKGLIIALRGKIGGPPVLASVDLGEPADANRKPPWLLIDRSRDQTAIDTANAWAAEHRWWFERSAPAAGDDRPRSR